VLLLRKKTNGKHYRKHTRDKHGKGNEKDAKQEKGDKAVDFAFTKKLKDKDDPVRMKMSASAPVIGGKLRSKSGGWSLPKASFDLPVFDRREKGLQEIPEDVFGREKLTKLVLLQNRISVIPPEIGNLTTLQHMDISHNSLVGLPDEIGKLQNLETLLLNGNFIKFPKTPFSLKSLTFLDLSRNRLEACPDFSAYAPHLTKLVLDKNKLDQGANLFSLMPKQLRHLSISHNSLSCVGDGVGNLDSLEFLCLSHNDIENLPQTMDKLVQLKSVDVSHNKLKDLPSSLNLPKLITFYANNNKIMDVNALFEAGAFSCLTDFNLANNKIVQMPSNFYSCSMLQHFLISSNRLTHIDPEIKDLDRLFTLDLGNNKLVDIPSEMSSLTNLTYLSFFNNKIAELPKDLTADMGILQFYYLSYTDVTEYRQSDKPFEKLEELNMNSSQLEVIPSSISVDMPNIRVLSLSNTNISEIPVELCSLKYLEQLDLSLNKIVTLPSEFFELKRLSVIDISYNQLESNTDEESWDKTSEWMGMRRLHVVNLSNNNLKEAPAGLLEAAQEFDADVNLSGNQIEDHNELIQGDRFQVAWAEMMGKRPTMEDAFCIKGSFMGDENIDLYGLFDGHASFEAARFCAVNLPPLLEKEFPMTDDEFPAAITKVFDELHTKFHTYIKSVAVHSPRARNCGATAVVVLIMNEVVHVASVGDSRAVVVRTDEIISATIDHKPESEEDRIRGLGGSVVNGRVNGLLAVSRSIGDFYLTPMVSHEPRCTRYNLTEKDEFIIMGCDGVWDEVSEKEAARLVRTKIRASVPRACTKLRDFAYMFGSDDNISAIVVRTGKRLKKKKMKKKKSKKKGPGSLSPKEDKKIVTDSVI